MTYLLKFIVGLKHIEYDVIFSLKVSRICDEYIFFALFPILNSVISVSYNLFDLSVFLYCNTNT